MFNNLCAWYTGIKWPSSHILVENVMKSWDTNNVEFWLTENFCMTVECSGNGEVSLFCLCILLHSQCCECAAVDTLVLVKWLHEPHSLVTLMQSHKSHKWAGNTIIGQSKKRTEAIKSKRNRKKKEQNTYENSVWTCNIVCITSLKRSH